MRPHCLEVEVDRNVILLRVVFLKAELIQTGKVEPAFAVQQLDERGNPANTKFGRRIATLSATKSRTLEDFPS